VELPIAVYIPVFWFNETLKQEFFLSKFKLFNLQLFAVTLTFTTLTHFLCQAILQRFQHMQEKDSIKDVHFKISVGS